MDLMEVGCVPGDWIALAEDRDQWQAYKGGNKPPGSLKANQLVSQACWLKQNLTSHSPEGILGSMDGSPGELSEELVTQEK